MLITPVEYKKFKVVTDLVPPVTYENYFKHNFYLTVKENGASLTIQKEEMWYIWAVNLLCGDEEKAEEALKEIIETKQEELKLLKSML